MDPQLFRTKSIDQLIADADRPEKRLKKSLGWLSLTSLGIGAVIGSGIFTVASIIFFTYIGFDSVSTAAEECHNPQWDVPIGIIVTLVICSLFYMGVAILLIGLVPGQSLIDDAASRESKFKTLRRIIKVHTRGASGKVRSSSTTVTVSWSGRERMPPNQNLLAEVPA